MRVHDFKCDACGAAFEAFLRSPDEAHDCPECGSPRSSLQPNLQISLGGMRRGRVVDMSSKSCPCGCARRGHAHR